MKIKQVQEKQPTFKERDCQQLGPASYKVVGMYPAGPHWVRVNESLESHMIGEKSRFFISVDLKFRHLDAMRDCGWYGYQRAEATKIATTLAENISKAVIALKAAKDTPHLGQAITIQLQSEKLNKLLDRYSATVE
jgi:hypothetical protein